MNATELSQLTFRPVPREGGVAVEAGQRPVGGPFPYPVG